VAFITIFDDDEPRKCQACDRFEQFHARCFIPNCTSCFHNIDEIKGHFSRENDDAQHKALDPTRELSIQELCKALDCTIKYDNSTKAIIFLNNLLAQTEEDSFNVTMTGGSSEGKTYTALECAAYFPESERIEIAGASPTSFFHDKGLAVKEIIDEEGRRDFEPIQDEIEGLASEISELQSKPKKTQGDRDLLAAKKGELHRLRSESKILVDFESKILIFLDQQNPELLKRLRGFFSHDKKYAEFSITNKNSRGANRTEHIVLKGYSSVVFCTAHSLFDEQEVTRNLLLSPETSQEKLNETLKLIAFKKANSRLFRKQVDANLERRSLLFRVELIRASGCSSFDSQQYWERILELFVKHRDIKQPRYQRDLPRIISLIYGNALLNLFNRNLKNHDGSEIEIKAQAIIEGFRLYESISEANENNVSPEVYSIWKEIISAGDGYEEIRKKYFEKNRRPLNQYKLREEIIPALKDASLLVQEQDPNDKRRLIFYPSTPEDAKKLTEDDYAILSTPSHTISQETGQSQSKDIVLEAVDNSASSPSSTGILAGSSLLKQEQAKALPLGETTLGFDFSQNGCRYQIFNRDFNDWDLEENSVDAIVTDPPYARKYLHLWEELGRLAKRVLKPSAFLVAYAGNFTVESEKKALAKKGLTFRACKTVKLVGLRDDDDNFDMKAHGFNDSRQVLIFQKEPTTSGYPEFDFKGFGRDKRYHVWGQPVEEFVQLVERFSKEGDLILEPFGGGGTTIQACIETRRNCIAYEIDYKAFETIQHRFLLFRAIRQLKK
jgi:hypothetical protein